MTTMSSDLYFSDETSTFSSLNESLVKQFASTTVKNQLRLYDILIPAIGAISICLNLLVVVSSGLILKKGQQPRSTYLFLGNVAMTDLITAVAIIFGQMFPKQHRDLNICAFQIGMIVSSTLASVYSVGLIAIDRFLYIIHGLQYQRWVYPMRARFCIATSWTIGIIIGFLPLMGWYGDTNNGQYCWFILLAPPRLIFLTVILGSIPLLTVVVLYGVILYHALNNIVRLQRAQRNNNAQNPVDSETGLRIFRGGGAATKTKSSDGRKEEESVFSSKVEEVNKDRENLGGGGSKIVDDGRESKELKDNELTSEDVNKVAKIEKFVKEDDGSIKKLGNKQNDGSNDKINSDKTSQTSDKDGKSPADSQLLETYKKRPNSTISITTSPETAAETTKTLSNKILNKLFKPKPPLPPPTINPNQTQSSGPSKWRAIKVVLFTSGSFLITWGPYFIATILYTYCDDEDFIHNQDKSSAYCKSLRILIASPLAILGFFNTLINPVIYAWWHRGFRTFVKNRWQSVRRRRRDQFGPASSGGGVGGIASNSQTKSTGGSASSS